MLKNKILCQLYFTTFTIYYKHFTFKKKSSKIYFDKYETKKDLRIYVVNKQHF